VTRKQEKERKREGEREREREKERERERKGERERERERDRETESRSSPTCCHGLEQLSAVDAEGADQVLCDLHSITERVAKVRRK
jgi:hypothetical protein